MGRLADDKPEENPNCVGDGPITWFTERQDRAFEFYKEAAAYLSNIKKTERLTKIAVTAWSMNCVVGIIVLIFTMHHYWDKLDMLAYVTHHVTLLLDDLAMTLVMYFLRNNVLYVMEKSKYTYNYDSDLVQDYAKELIGTRVKQMEKLAKLVSLLPKLIFFAIQVCYLLETFFMQTYKSLFPVHFGSYLDNPVILVLTIIWQASLVYYTNGLVTSLITLGYLGWNHLSLEINILCHAIHSTHEIVEEQCKKTNAHGIGERAAIYKRHLNHVVKHHQAILLYYEYFKNAVKWVCTFLFLVGMCMFVTVGIGVTAGNIPTKMKLLTFLTEQFWITYFWHWIGQYLNDKGEEISLACAHVPWWLMPQHCRFSLLMIMERCKTPIDLKTALGQAVNLAAFMDMITTCYQAMNVLIQAKSG